MKTTKCKVCGSTDITVTVTVNPNNIARITDYCHDDETITEDGWCNACCEYVELETVAESKPESDAPSILDWTPLYLKQHRKENGMLTDWYPVESLPESWPEGSTLNFYHATENKLYLVPDDSVRYYMIANGVLCFHCDKPIDITVDLHAENRKDYRRCLCKTCWGGVNHGEIDLPTIEDGIPIYRLKNSPILK